MEFCENCGAQLPVQVPAGAGLPSNSPAGFNGGPGAAQSGPSASQLVCPNPNCRAPLSAGDEFCFNCGTDVRNLTGAAPGGGPKPDPDPNAATLVAAPPQMKDEDINRMLSEMNNPNPPASAPASAPTPPQPASPGAGGIPAAGPLSASNAGPEAQPATVPAQVVTPPAPAQTNGGSLPVPPGPSGGIAGNAFGAPPAPVPAAQPAPANGSATGGSLSLNIAGPYGDETVDWQGKEILLGRNDAKTRVFPEVNLDDSAASRRHLSIWLEDVDHKYYAQDLESANGTLLNGRDLKPGEPTIINNGDELKIGTRYTIKVRIS